MRYLTHLVADVGAQKQEARADGGSRVGTTQMIDLGGTRSDEKRERLGYRTADSVENVDHEFLTDKDCEHQVNGGKPAKPLTNVVGAISHGDDSSGVEEAKQTEESPVCNKYAVDQPTYRLRKEFRRHFWCEVEQFFVVLFLLGEVLLGETRRRGSNSRGSGLDLARLPKGLPAKSTA